MKTYTRAFVEERGHVAVLGTGEVDAQSLNPRHSRRDAQMACWLQFGCWTCIQILARMELKVPLGLTIETLESSVFSEPSLSDARYHMLLQTVARVGIRRSRHVVSQSDTINPLTPFSPLTLPSPHSLTGCGERH